jgi:hypothetical protein
MKKELVVFLLLIAGIIIFARVSHKDAPKQPTTHKHQGGCCGGH